MSDEKKYQLTESELNKLCEDASVSNAVKELANILSGRSQDLPHRFRAPVALAQFFSPDYPNQTYTYHTNIRGDSINSQHDQHQIMGTSNPAYPLIMRITTRPAQHILELEFNDACGSRLFTLEIEYALPNDKVPQL